MAYKAVEPERGIPVPVANKGMGKFPPGTHRCRIVSVAKHPDDISVALYHPTHGLHTETILEGWPVPAERGEELVVFVTLTPGCVAEKHPANGEYRLVDALTREPVTEYNSDVSSLLVGRILAAPIIEEVTYNNRVYKIKAMVKV